MTEDHSAVMDLVHRGLLTLDEARHHPDKNVILRALGSQRQVAVASWPQPLPLRPGDAFLLCSDGLSDLVGDEELRLALLAHDAQDACDSLVAMARERGGHDNISVAILALRDEAPPVPARPTREAEAQS
jgi:protein phosphatase